jgi:phospholipase C
VLSLPHYGGEGAKALFITPTDYITGKLVDPPPVDFNAPPSTNPGIPVSGTWSH